MKNYNKNYLLLLAVIFLILSCNIDSRSQKLIDADRMLNEQKLDSAVHMLKTVDANSLAKSKQDSMYYTLLCLKYKDKVGKPFTYIDSTLSLRLISYFEKHDKRMLPEAYYYTGRLHQMRNNYPMALDFYQKSQSLLEKEFEDIQLKALVYGQISDVFYFQGIQPKAIEMNKKAIACFEELRDTSSLVTLLVNTAYIYLEQGHYYVCMKFLKRAEQLIQNKVHEKNDLQTLINIYKGACLLKKHNYQSALMLVRIIPKSNIPKEILPTAYSFFYETYYAIGMTDSSYYYSKLISQNADIRVKENAFRMMYKTMLKENRSKEAATYMEKYDMYTDSVRAFNASDKLLSMNAAYNYGRYVEENQALTKQNTIQSHTIVILILLVVSFILVYWTYRLKVINKEKLLSLKIEDIMRIKQEEFELREEKLKKEMAILEQCLQNEKDICKKQKDYIELQRTKLEERLKKDEVSMIEHEKILSEILQSNTYISMRKYVENPIKSKMKESAINWEELRKKLIFVFHNYLKF